MNLEFRTLLKPNYVNPDNKILILCMPKTASSYISQVVALILKCRHVGMMYSNKKGTQLWFDEHIISEQMILQFRHTKTVSQQHTIASKNSLKTLKKYKLKPIILTRNIYDFLVSFYNHVHKENRFQTLGFIPNLFFKMTDEEKIDFLIHTHLPWVVNFLLSWEEASKDFTCKWMTYESFFENQIVSFQKIFQFYNIEFGEDFIKEQIDLLIEKAGTKSTRFNKGVVGRGKLVISNRQKLIIKQKFDSCPFQNRDFIYQMIGLV